MDVRPLLIALVAIGLTGCSQSEQDRAKQRADEDARRAKQDLHQLGKDIRKEARDANAELQKGMNGNTNSPAQARAKLDHAGAEAEAAARQAGRKLDHATLIARVKTKLASDAGISTMSNVSVDVNGTVVTLHGTVNTPEQKRLALQAASKVDGVTQVRDEIAVAP